MISVNRMDLAANGRGLCDIDRVLFRVAKSRVKNWEVLVRQKYTDNLGFSILLPDFLTRDKATLNNTLSISHSPRSPAAGPKRYAEIMKSP